MGRVAGFNFFLPRKTGAEGEEAEEEGTRPFVFIPNCNNGMFLSNESAILPLRGFTRAILVLLSPYCS